MTFDPAQHPREKTGQFAEKTGAAAEVELSVSTLDAQLFDETRDTADAAYAEYGRQRAAEEARMLFPTAARAELVEVDGEGRAEYPQYTVIAIEAVYDEEGNELWRHDENAPSTSLRYAATSVSQPSASLDLTGAADQRAAWKEYEHRSWEAMNTGQQALANSLRRVFPTATAVVLDEEGDDPDVRRPLAIVNKEGERIWTAGSGDDSVFAEGSRELEYLSATHTDYAEETDDVIAPLPADLFNEATWPESTPF